MVELPLFEEVGEVVRGLVPRDFGELRCRARRYGIKVWVGGPAALDRAPREHYEAQVLSPRAVEGARVLVLEIGFHAEHPDLALNEAAVSALVAVEKKWRRVVGAEAEVGPFLGKADLWRRISETWVDPNLSEPDLAWEVGARLTDYICALEPLRA